MTEPKNKDDKANDQSMAHPGEQKPAFIEELKPFVRLVLKRFGQDQCLRIATALSYTTLLALVPLGAIAFSIFRAFPVFDDVQEQVKSLLFENFMPESVDGAGAYFDHFISQTQGLTAIGTIALAITAIMLLSTIETALNAIFHVKTKRPFVPRLLMFWAVLTIGPLLLGGSLSLGTYFLVVKSWVSTDAFSGLGGVMTTVLPTILAIGAFSVFYAIVPNRPVRARDALIGGLAAGLLFGVVRKLFALYITTFPAYQTIYGALSTLPIFLIWMFFSWAIVLVGAQITANMPQWAKSSEGESFDQLVPARQLETALAAMENLWRQSRGEDDLNPARGRARTDELAEALEVLRQNGFVDISDRGDWLLVRDVECITISGLAHGLGLAPNPDDLRFPGRRRWQAYLHKALQGGEGVGLGSTLRQLFEGKA